MNVHEIFRRRTSCDKEQSITFWDYRILNPDPDHEYTIVFYQFFHVPMPPVTREPVLRSNSKGQKVKVTTPHNAHTRNTPQLVNFAEILLY